MKIMKRGLLYAIIVIIVVVSVIGVMQYSPKNVNDTPVVEEGEYPDSLEPAVTYSTPGWEIINQILMTKIC
jgi:hypothetical protein